jgi:hypothetical protein
MVATTQSRITLRARPKADIDPSFGPEGTFTLEQNVPIVAPNDDEVLVKVDSCV